MSALFRIVYAAHANGTHHKLALDALNHMQRADAETWRRVFLKHVEKFLEGSKAPDKTFKDFKNHVLHVGESYWGGAPEKVEEWYGTTVEALRAGNWADAAYAAGVLSHYYTDPVMPFHTGQTEAENAIHRATEWSINRSYNALRKIGEDRYGLIAVPRRDGADWLKEMTCDGAETAHRYYEKLIAHYDIHRGVVVPEEGLDSISRTFIAELLMYAAEGYGLLLDRAIAEAGVAAPEVSLTVETFLATLKIPSKWIEKKLTNAEDRKLVQAMYDELKATGRVDATLPEDDRTIRDLHATEVLAPKLAKRSAKRAERLPAANAPSVITNIARCKEALDTTARPPLPSAKAVPTAKAAPVAPVAPPAPVQSAPPLELPVATLPAAMPEPVVTPEPVARASVPITAAPLQDVETVSSAPRFEPEIESVHTAPPAPLQEIEAAHAPLDEQAQLPPEPLHDTSSVTAMPVSAAPEPADLRYYLSESDPLEDAPSIGPKMAARFAALGIHSVADFLGHDPHDMAELLDDSRIDGEVLTDWQDQAQLVMDVPGMRGGGAQLLVGAGYRTVHAIADADPVDLSADVLTYATSSDGKRILRDGQPPDLEKIKSWVTAAAAALAA